MYKSDSIIELAKALSKAQALIKPAIKDSENPFFKSHYADLSAVWEAARIAITSNGLSVTQLINTSEGNNINVETILLHESGEWISGAFNMPYLKVDPQAVGSAITYARRYALAAIIGIVADEDDDGNKAAEKGQGAKPPMQPPAEKKPEPPKDGEKDLRAETVRMIMEVEGIDGAEAKLIEFSGFQGKNQKGETKWVEGKGDINQLSEAAVKVTYGKVKKWYEEWKNPPEIK